MRLSASTAASRIQSRCRSGDLRASACRVSPRSRAPTLAAAAQAGAEAAPAALRSGARPR